MVRLDNKQVLVIGLGVSGVAASQLLMRCGALVSAIDSSDNRELRLQAEQLRAAGVKVQLGATAAPGGIFELVVVSPGVPPENPIVASLKARGVPIIGEFEFGSQNSLCLNIAITGTNGKTTTTELVERLLRHNQVRTMAAGNIGVPLCGVVEQTRELDFLTLEVSSFQLETIKFFRPAIAVMLNITPDHLDRYSSMSEYIRAKGRLFENQQGFDWAVIQSEALTLLRAEKVSIPSKIITFSANDRTADITLERGLLISRMEDWPGPLLNMDQCLLRGPHNAENLMATLAIGRILRVPLERMIETLKNYAPAPHRCEQVADIDGVRFVNDSKATNVDAVQKALLSTQPSRDSAPNVWLIAGGRDKGLDYHDLGPLLSQRVKGVFLIGEAREKIRAAWGLFTSCTPVDSLLEAVRRAADSAVAGDVVLLSPACSSFDQFRNYQHRGDVFREAVARLGEKGVSSPATQVSKTKQINSVEVTN
jgi:UDP-N-acetylmuramoylalanine--D-glutamate ligase